MALPETVRVKLSSEAAEAISLTPVVVQDLPLRELIEHMLGVTGKDEPRIREMLHRGTLVSGASRFRWTGWEPEAEALHAMLATFPDPDPSRTFARASCVLAVLRGGRASVAIPRAAGERKGFFRRGSFWDALMEVAAPGLEYSGYSYRDKADRYARELTLAEAARVRESSGLIRYSTLRNQIRSLGFHVVELLVERR